MVYVIHVVLTLKAGQVNDFLKKFVLNYSSKLIVLTKLRIKSQ